MKKQKNAIEKMKKGRSYTHKELVNELLHDKPEMSRNSAQWMIRDYCDAGELIHEGYNSYVVAGEAQRMKYKPRYSDHAEEIMTRVEEAYPLIKFTVFETLLMNDFLRHLIMQNTIFIQCEKDASAFVFRSLQEAGYKDLMYKPSEKEYEYYWSRNCVVVTDLISEAPTDHNDPHAVTIEKMMVDMYCDKNINWTYSQAEYPDVIKNVMEMYSVDLTKLYRYARRRNREKEIRAIIEENENA